MKKTILLLLFVIGVWPFLQNGEFTFSQINLLSAQSFGSETGSDTKSGNADYLIVNFRNNDNSEDISSQNPGTSFEHTFYIYTYGTAASVNVTCSSVYQSGSTGYITSISCPSFSSSTWKLLNSVSYAVTVKGKYPSSISQYIITFKNADQTANYYMNFTPILTPPAPTNLTATNISTSTCTLSWTAPSGVVDGYYINKDGIKLPTVYTTTTAIDINVNTSPGVQTFFTVSAFNTNGVGPESNVVAFTANPINITLNTPPPPVMGQTSVRLTWTTNANILAYYIFQDDVELPTPIYSTTKLITGLSPHNNAFYNYVFKVIGIVDEENIIVSNSVNVLIRDMLWCLTKSSTSNVDNELISAEKLGVSKSDSLTQENVLLYPNPVNDKIFIEGLNDFEATILDLSGKKILNFKNVNRCIDVSELSRGTYIIQIKNDGVNMTKKIIKQ